MLRDQEYGITQQYNEVALKLVLPQETIEATRRHKQEDGYFA